MQKTNMDLHLLLHLLDEDSKGSIEFIQLLLNYGADINIQNAEGETILHHMATEQKYKTVLFLLEHGANPTIQTTSGDTPLHQAARFCNQPKNVKIIKLLLDHGASLNIKGSFQETALSVAAEEENLQGVMLMLDHYKRLKNLVLPIEKLAYFCDINKKFKSEAIAFLCSLKLNQRQTHIKIPKPIIQLILSKNTNIPNMTTLEDFINMKDKDGKTALDWARERKNEAIVQCIEAFKKENDLN